MNSSSSRVAGQWEISSSLVDFSGRMVILVTYMSALLKRIGEVKHT